MASKRYERRQEVHFRAMWPLREELAIFTPRIVHRVGISNGAAYYCVAGLVTKGFIKLKNFTKPQTKGDYLYEFTPSRIRAKIALTVNFLERKRQEYSDLKMEILRFETKLGLNIPGSSEALEGLA